LIICCCCCRRRQRWCLSCVADCSFSCLRCWSVKIRRSLRKRSMTLQV
jgi:hypothetical protein